MSEENEKSPAVVSLEQEQARQNMHNGKGDLDAALEGTFPASDPVSMSTTSIPTGRSDNGAAQAKGDAASFSKSKATLMDDALDLVRENPLQALGIVAAIAFVYGASR